MFPKLIVEVERPTELRLNIDKPKISRTLGTDLVQVIRSRLSRGQDGDGSPISEPDAGNNAMQRTGRLIAEIEYDPRTETVGASTRPRGDAGTLGSSDALLRYHIRTGRLRDPLGERAAATQRRLQKNLDRELQKQARRSGGILTAQGVQRETWSVE